MKPVRFHPAAEAELAAEAAHDDERSPGLGERFVTEIEAACALAAGFSGIGSPYRYGTRRVFAKRFPFAIVYRELPDEIVVLEAGRVTQRGTLEELSSQAGYFRKAANLQLTGIADER